MNDREDTLLCRLVRAILAYCVLEQKQQRLTSASCRYDTANTQFITDLPTSGEIGTP